MKMEFVEPEPVPDPQPEETPQEVPASGESVGPVRKFYVAEMKALKNGDVEAYVSTEAVDRVGDVIKAKGWELGNYKKTGAPVLFSHDYSQPPIGNAVEMEIQRKGLWSVTRFHEKTQMSRDLAMLAREGYMKSWSVGFNPTEQPEMRKDDKGNFLGYIFNKQELLEYSLVAVPANPEAVSKAIHLSQRGLISHQMASIIAGPSPVAEWDGGFGGKEQALRAKQAEEQHDAKIAANYFLKGYFNGKTR
jgi:HK97 family phage prohead protease